MASSILKGLVTNDGIDRLQNRNQPQRPNHWQQGQDCQPWFKNKIDIKSVLDNKLIGSHFSHLLEYHRQKQVFHQAHRKKKLYFFIQKLFRELITWASIGKWFCITHCTLTLNLILILMLKSPFLVMLNKVYVCTLFRQTKPKQRLKAEADNP